MPLKNLELLQFVGFSTDLPAEIFIQRWKPIAQNFKRQGILEIDLYAVRQQTSLNFLSKNTWAVKNYLQVFPSGLANNSGDGNITVTQFGAYLLDMQELNWQQDLYFSFSKEMEVPSRDQFVLPSLQKDFIFKSLIVTIQAPLHRNTGTIQICCQPLITL